MWKKYEKAKVTIPFTFKLARREQTEIKAQPFLTAEAAITIIPAEIHKKTKKIEK